MTPVDDLDVIEAMRRYGGGFVRALAEAAARADRDNRQRIKQAFSREWIRYREMVEAARAPKPAAGKEGA